MKYIFLLAVASLIALGGAGLFFSSGNYNKSTSVLFRCVIPSEGSIKLISDAGERTEILTVSKACELASFQLNPTAEETPVSIVHTTKDNVVTEINLLYPDNWTQSNEGNRYVVIDILPTAPFIAVGEI